MKSENTNAKKARRRGLSKWLLLRIWLKDYERLVEKHARTYLCFVWFATTIMDVGNKFHYNFQVGFRVHMLGYKGMI